VESPGTDRSGTYALPRVAGLSTPILVALFLVASGVTWVAGMGLSSTTDELDHRLGLGAALGGMILLAIAGSLPEIAITVTAASQGNLGLAAGNLIGGIAIQTMVLVVCDLAASSKRPLTYLVGSLVPVVEGLTVVLVVGEVLLGALLPASDAVGPVSPASIAIVVTWFGLLWVLSRIQADPRWEVVMPGSAPGRPDRSVREEQHPKRHAARPTAVVAALFGVGCLATLGGGVVLEAGGNVLANRAGVNGVVFGATVLALATALPEISSGIAAVRVGDHQLATGDIFGGNAFQVCLFLVADLVAGRPVLPTAGILNSWLGGLGILLTVIYVTGVIARPRRCFLRLGIDSVLVILVFALGVIGLTALPK
jgi:cation:H+ antiporter